MQGNDQRRFCEHCQLHVHNLSRMTAGERRALLDGGGHLCVTYTVDEKGAFIEQARRHPALGFFTRLRAVALALAATILPFGASYANRQIMGTPIPPPPPPPTPTPGTPAPRGQILIGEVGPTTPTPAPIPPILGQVAIPPPPTPKP